MRKKSNSGEGYYMVGYALPAVYLHTHGVTKAFSASRSLGLPLGECTRKLILKGSFL